MTLLLAGATGLVVAGSPAAAADPLPGGLKMWGFNSGGELGDGTRAERNRPISVPGMTGNVIQVGLGASHTVALRSDGTVWTWGQNSLGGLGLGPHMDTVSTPTQLGLGGVTQISVAAFSALALRSDGSVWAWGFSANGDGSTEDILYVPTEILPAGSAVQVSAAFLAGLALRPDGRVLAWGTNPADAIGPALPTPTLVDGLSGIVQVSVGLNAGVAIQSTGAAALNTVWTWGYPLGTLDPSLPPHQMPGLTGITQVEMSDDSAIALGPDGSVWTWGHNTDGDLGNGTLVPNPTPTRVAGISQATQVDATGYDMAVVLAGGAVRTWGDNAKGELGDGTTTNRTTPVAVAGLDDASQISIGISDMAAITSFDFSLAVAPALVTVTAGAATTTTVSVLPVRGAGAVTLAAPQRPPGSFAGFDRSSVNTGASATLTVQTTIATPAGTYPMSIAGSAFTEQGTVNRGAEAKVRVTSGSDPGCAGAAIPIHPPAIPDSGSPLDTTITVGSCPSPGPVAGVQVFIVHPRRGDLVIDLIGPDGSRYRVKDSDKTDTAPNVNQIFSVALAGVTGTLGPQGWTLRVTDVVTGSGGVLAGWALVL